jgi:hypothetical protein
VRTRVWNRLPQSAPSQPASMQPAPPTSSSGQPPSTGPTLAQMPDPNAAPCWGERGRNEGDCEAAAWGRKAEEEVGANAGVESLISILGKLFFACKRFHTRVRTYFLLSFPSPRSRFTVWIWHLSQRWTCARRLPATRSRWCWLHGCRLTRSRLPKRCTISILGKLFFACKRFHTRVRTYFLLSFPSLSQRWTCARRLPATRSRWCWLHGCRLTRSRLRLSIGKLFFACKRFHTRVRTYFLLSFPSPRSRFTVPL